MGLFGLGKKAPKINLPGKEFISEDWMSFPGAKEYYGYGKGQLGMSNTLADRYYNEMYGPAAKQFDFAYENAIAPQALANAGAMGMTRSSLTQDLLNRAYTGGKLDLAKYGADLKTRGFETGLGQERFGAGIMSDVADKSSAQQQRAGDWQVGLADKLYGAQKERYASNQDELMRSLLTAGSVIAAPFTGGASLAGLGGGSSSGGDSGWLQTLLTNQLGGQSGNWWENIFPSRSVGSGGGVSIGGGRSTMRPGYRLNFRKGTIPGR